MENSSTFTARQKRVLRAAAEEQQEHMRGASLWRNVDFLLYILAVMLVAFGIRMFVFEPIRVEGDSMVPTLINKEHMFVEKVSYWFAPPDRGDIVICFYPGYTESCVKRVIGLPGERIRVTNGEVYINDQKLDESFYWDSEILYDTESVTVGEKAVFVMGDNRNGSKDSRAESVGCIPYGKIVGHVRAVIWPISSWRGIRRVDY